VISLLSEVQQFHLSGSNNSDNGTIFLDSVQLYIDWFACFIVFFGVFREGLLFAVLPVFVESSEGVFV